MRWHQFGIAHLLMLTLTVAVICWGWPYIVPNAIFLIKEIFSR